MRKSLLLIMTFCLTFALASQAQVLIDDNFDNYLLGAVGPQASHWDTWSGVPTEEGEVSDDIAYSGTKSLKIYGQGGPVDAVLLLGNQTSGHFRLEFRLYVVNGQAAYFNHQKDQTSLGNFWGQEVYFENDGSGALDAGGTNAATFTYPHDAWMKVVQYFDLDNDRTSLVVNNELLYSWPLNESSQGTSNGTLQIGAIDFYGRSSSYHLFYIDDVKFTQIPSLPNAGAVVKLQVDMADYLDNGNTISSDGIHVAGTFNGWSTDSTMLEANGDSTYSQFVTVEQFTTMEYKFLNGNTWAGEETVPAECGVDNGQGGYNRELGVFFMDSTAQLICFSACISCDSLAVNTEEITFGKSLEVYPNPAYHQAFIEFNFEHSTDLNIKIINNIGQVVQEQHFTNLNNGVETIDVSKLSAGLYFINISDGYKQTTEKIVIGK